MIMYIFCLPEDTMVELYLSFQLFPVTVAPELILSQGPASLLHPFPSLS